MPKNCLNCGEILTARYCPDCGQSATTKRYTGKDLLHDIPHSIFHVDKGLLYTFTQLLIRPGKAIGEYLDGKRVNHFKPLAYLFILTAISAFVSHQRAGMVEGTTIYNPDLISLTAAKFFDKYPALIFCILIPLISLWSWLFNRNSSRNYWENIILNTYIIAQFNIFYIVNDLLKMISGVEYTTMTPTILVFFGYLIFAYSQFFKKQATIQGIVLTTIMYIFMVFTILTGFTLTGFMTPWWM